MTLSVDHIVINTTATQFPDVPCRRAMIKIRSTNDTEVWLGEDNSVTAGVNGNGFPVGNDGVVFEEIGNLNEIWGIATSSTSCRYIAER